VKGGYVYIMTNKPQGTLYIGVTSNLEQMVLAWNRHCERQRSNPLGFAAIA
jgi:predicted GIY-YIG superfamily endonuclease